MGKKDNGTIWLHRGSVGFSPMHNRDLKALEQCGCPISFQMSQYDDVLKKVSAHGYDLGTDLSVRGKGDSTGSGIADELWDVLSDILEECDTRVPWALRKEALQTIVKAQKLAHPFGAPLRVSTRKS